MSARRGWVERLSGGRTASTTEPSASRPEPGPDRPVRSNGPEPLPGPGPRARPPVPDPEGPTLRVVLVSRDNMLAGALRSLIEAPGGVRVLDWYGEELDSAIRHADVVIVDMPPNLHERTFAVIGGRFLGRTVVLLQEGEHAETLPAGPSRAVLYRPLQIGELWTAITGAATPGPAAPPEEAEAGSPAPAPELEEPEAGAEEAADDHAAPGEAEEAAAAAAAAVEVAGQGLPVAESGRLIGLSGRELEPVIGPGQVAPGMDEATFERLRRWGRPAPGKTGKPAGKRRTTAGRAEARRAKEARAEARRAARAAAGRAKAASAEARREQTRQERAARQEARQSARAEVARVRAARAESRTAARKASRQAKAANAEARQVARAESRQARADARQAAKERSRAAKAAKAEARAAAQEESRQAKVAQAEARAAEQEKAHRAKAAQAEARAAEQEEAHQAKAAQAAARAAAQEEARQAKAAQAEARRVARVEAGQAKAAKAEARRVARAEARAARVTRSEERRAAGAAARQARAAEAAVRRAARTEARQVKAAETTARRAERAEARQVKAAEAKARRAERAEARGVAREEARQARAVRAEARRVARAEAGQARAVRREEARQARAARAETRRTARAEARQARAASTEARRERSRQTRAASAAARTAAREEAARARAAQAEARQAARAEEDRKRAAEAEVRRAQAQQARAEQAEAREAARAEAARKQAEQAEARKVARAEAAQRQAEQAEARKVARAEAAQQRQARAETRKAARAEAGQKRAAQAETRKAARAEAAQQRRVQAEARRAQSQEAKTARAQAREVARAEAGRKRAEQAEMRRVAQAEATQRRAAKAEGRKVARAEAARQREARGAGAEARVGLLALVVLVVAVVGLVAAGWRGGGGPDGRAGEVAVVRAAGGSEGGLVVQDPRVGPIEPLYALGVGVVLRGAEAGTSLEAAIRDARVPSRYLLAGVVGLTVLLFLLLMRVGPGTGAAAGPGPAPPQRQGRDRLWRLGGAALAGLLVALDPVLVRSGRAATGTVLAVLLALATLALAWGVPARPTLRWLPLFAAGGGLALLVSPLALPVLAVPVVAELLEGRYQEAWRDMAALGIAVGLWLVLPVWVAGQELGAGQAGWLLGRPPGRGSVVASLADDRLTWLLVAGGLAAAMLAWRHRSGARPDPDPGPPGPARVLAWTMTTAAGAVGAVALGYPASQALPFAVPAAAVSLALAGGWAAAAVRVDRGTGGLVPRWIGAGVAVALAGLLVAQGVDSGARYGQADDGLGRLVATVGDQVPDCSAVNASGPDDRARLLSAGVTVTEFADGPAAHAAGVRYFVLTGGSAGGGPMTPSLAAWVRQHGTRMAAHPSRSLSGVELWRVDAAPLDPVADSLPVADGLFSNVNGSACGGYRVVDSQAGTFHTAYRAAGGKMVLGRPLGSVWTSDGPALQAFDTMVLGSVPTASGPPAVRPIELPPLLAKLDVEAVADADIPLPSVRPPVTDRQVRTLLSEELIARAYLGTDPASASAEDFRRARDRFGRPLGVAQMMPDGAMRQPFERAVLELPAGGGPARPAALGRLAVRLGLVPKQAMRLEPVPGLPAPPAETRLDPAPLLRLIGVGLVLLALAAGAGAVVARRSRTGGAR